jgi:Zn-dependent protease/predicted transcriptional regulator
VLRPCDGYTQLRFLKVGRGGGSVNESFRFGRIAGISVGINWSLIAIFLLIAVSLAAGRFPTVFPDQPAWAYAVAGSITAVLFFASVLAHEISHALVAQRNGIEVDGIVLWLLGGVARLKGDAESPGVAFRIAIVGPMVSLILGILFLTAAFALDQADALGLVVESALWLGIINIILAVFNLFPGAPLDGGRVLRSILWRINGDKHRSWVQAAKAGRVVGFIVIGLGILQFAAIGIGGLWLVLIGWFLVMAAAAEESHAKMHGALGDTRVADVMSQHPVTAPADITVDQFLEQYVFEYRYSTFPITSPAGEVTGLVIVDSVRTVAPERRSTVRLADLAVPLAEVPAATVDDSLAEVLDKFGLIDDGRVLVMRGTDLVGIVSPADVMRLLELRELVGPSSRPIGRG